MGVIRPAPRKATKVTTRNKGGGKKGINKKTSPTDLPGPGSTIQAPTDNVDTTANIKRQGDTQPGPAPKRQAIQSSDIGSSGQIPSAGRQVGEMSNLTGTGKEMADIGGDGNSSMVYEIDRPLSIFGPKISTYKKTHKFMTFGLAPNILPYSDGDGTTFQRRAFLTTYLAEIPWHIPALYLNPSEFQLLGIGARCVGVSIEVFYRGSTIQFSTASTATSLATLNQINDIAVAHALNKTGQGSNVSYTEFGSTQTMIPLQIARPKYDSVGTTYRGMERDYYGTPNTESDNFINFFPHHQIGRQTFLYNYWALSAIANTDVNTTAMQIGGWPLLTDKIEQIDGKTAVNTCVLKSEYTPKMGMLKMPILNTGHGLPAVNTQSSSMRIQCGTHLPNMREAELIPVQQGTTSDAQRAGTFENAGGDMNNLIAGDPSANSQTLTIYTPLEKSQYTRTGSWGAMDPHVQPSIHIGVQPVPALTTSATLINSAGDGAWTDVRAYWEVTATMQVMEQQKTAYPWAPTANVPPGDVIYFNDPDAKIPAFNLNPRDDGATWQGLYTNFAPELGPDITPPT